jgi:hypothetical protein
LVVWLNFSFFCPLVDFNIPISKVITCLLH